MVDNGGWVLHTMFWILPPKSLCWSAFGLFSVRDLWGR